MSNELAMCVVAVPIAVAALVLGAFTEWLKRDFRAKRGVGRGPTKAP